ncbi:hypothetical protein MIMGU_mgv1a019696mg [Erythranthe guttata]|uniref:Uncharacterized protein n=1 Tax=Erythranthe guttata TaxID=4155 RepID=A0A022R875_ERYGU|nr:PREDICTED: uncharacterized protein LOC105960552 [Erythranthe guttata]EYU35085.1 hypothetical protein MIMGU_mgv1a019696mg [Erythranthe guttata]|eukprot:XP_012840196.1 PREDICTED: uncharacterized protein LOC105960552 [Erythranthe guttata]
MDPKTDKLVRRTTMIATVTASYFLLTADYGPEPNFLEPNFLDPIKRAIKSTEKSVKDFVFGTKKDAQQSEINNKVTSDVPEKHP